MSHKKLTALPHPALRPYVRCYLHLQMGQAGQSVQAALPAKTEQAIFVNTGPAPTIWRVEAPGCDISGNPYCCKVRGAISNADLQIDLHGLLHMFVIVFHPGRFADFFGMPAQHISEGYMAAIDVLGKEWENLGERIREETSFEKQTAIAEAMLLKRMPRWTSASGSLDEVIALIRSGAREPVHQLARKAFLCERQFRRQFLQKTGVGPTRFIAICRLQQLILKKKLQPGISWRQLAFEEGYSDQTHLIRDMKKFVSGSESLASIEEHFIDAAGTSFRLIGHATKT